MKRSLILLISVLFATPVFSQNITTVRFDIELLNRHFWRGEQLGNAPAIEPNVTISKNDFNFSIWGAQTFNNSYSEIDLMPAYSFGNYTTILYDYYNPIPGADNNYFTFSGKNNRHSGELAISYNGNGTLPIRILAGTFLYGDRNPKTNKAFFSTYLELAYPITIKRIEMHLHAGFTPAKGYYAESFACVNTGLTLKTVVKISNYFRVPFKMSGLYNPDTSKAFFIFGVGLSKI